MIIVEQTILNMDEDIFISKIEIKGEPFYIKINWKRSEHDMFHLQLLNDHSSWSGKYSIETANQYREIVDEEEQIYKSNVKRCLCDNSNEYIIDFAIESSSSGTFSWKKKFEGSTAVLVHGKLKLQLDNQTNTKGNLIDELLSRNNELKGKIEYFKQENDRLSKDLEKCKTDLTSFADMKTSMESTLYSKFIQLLNVKKRRIQLLEDILKDYERGVH